MPVLNAVCVCVTVMSKVVKVCVWVVMAGVMKVYMGGDGVGGEGVWVVKDSGRS